MAIPKFDVRTAVWVPKTAELVAAYIRRRIVRGELQRDDALPPESALMEQFSVSRPTLREAFRILESEGLITIRRGARGGARVQVPTTEVAAGYVGLVLQYPAPPSPTSSMPGHRRVAAAAMLARRRDHESRRPCGPGSSTTSGRVPPMSTTRTTAPLPRLQPPPRLAHRERNPDPPDGHARDLIRVRASGGAPDRGSVR